MDLTLLRDLYKDPASFDGKTLSIGGWVRSIRDSKSIGFIVLADGTCFSTLQVVYEAEKVQNFDEISHIPVGSAIIVTGQLLLTPNAKQPFELHAEKVEVEGLSTPDYPLQKKRHTMEYLRTIAHLRPRSNTFQAVFRVRSLAAFAIHKFFQERGFVYVNTPIITGSDAEGAGEMFRVTTIDPKKQAFKEDGTPDFSEDFFGKMASLTVSGQLNGETFATAFRNIYTFGPTFRAENSNTPRHAAEFWMMEPEVCFADLADVCQLEEDMLKYVIRYLLENAKEELNFFNSFIDKGLLARLQNIVDKDFVRCPYTKAVEILKKSGQKFDYEPEWGIDLQTEHERYLTEVAFEGSPVFVTDYPKDIKAFYMRLNEDGRTVAAADLLVPGVGELCGGSQREERLDVLEARIRELGMKEEDYWWYLDLRRYGTVKHGGFGLGFERLIMYVTGMGNIRDVVPFPRTVNNLEF